MDCSICCSPVEAFKGPSEVKCFWHATVKDDDFDNAPQFISSKLDWTWKSECQLSMWTGTLGSLACCRNWSVVVGGCRWWATVRWVLLACQTLLASSLITCAGEHCHISLQYHVPRENIAERPQYILMIHVLQGYASGKSFTSQTSHRSYISMYICICVYRLLGMTWYHSHV